VREIHDTCFPHSPNREVPDVANEYLVREIPWLLAKRA